MESRRAAESGVKRPVYDVADPRLAGLRAEREATSWDRMPACTGTSRTVVGTTDRVEVVLDAVARIGSTDHPRPVRREHPANCARTKPGRPCRADSRTS